MALGLVRQPCVPVRADIEERTKLAIHIAQKYWMAEQVERDEVPRPLDLPDHGDRVPRGQEYIAQLSLVVLVAAIMVRAQQMAEMAQVGEHGGVNCQWSIVDCALPCVKVAARPTIN